MESSPPFKPILAFEILLRLEPMVHVLVKPERAEYYYITGRCYEKLGMFSIAKHYYQRAWRVDKRPDILLAKAFRHAALNEIDSVRSVLHTVYPLISQDSPYAPLYKQLFQIAGEAE